MIEEDALRESLKIALESSNAEQTEVMVISEVSSLTRFSNSQIHQNTSEENTRLNVRTIQRKKIGTSSGNQLQPENIKKIVGQALGNSKFSPEDGAFVSLPKAPPITRKEKYIPATARCTPQDRAEIVSCLLELPNQKRLKSAGALSTTSLAVGIANSLGTESVAMITEGTLNFLAMGENSSGYAEFVSTNIEDLNPESLAEVAVKKALTSADPFKLEPSSYEVILEPVAVANLLSFLALVGLGAQAVQEKRSFMVGNYGKQLVSEKINLWDDGEDPQTLGLPFDFEGVPKKKVVFFDKGIAKDVVYDSYTAAKEGKKSTGHALPAPNIYGPLPTNLFLGTGDVSLDEMIASTEQGILVTRFHYTNIEDPLKTILTGMTRDGTFLIEKGKITNGIKNLRFTQSILEALSNVEMISSEAKLVQSNLGPCYTPALKLSAFNFTGVTEF